jgi:hypothetical protein
MAEGRFAPSCLIQERFDLFQLLQETHMNGHNKGETGVILNSGVVQNVSLIFKRKKQRMKINMKL